LRDADTHFSLDDAPLLHAGANEQRGDDRLRALVLVWADAAPRITSIVFLLIPDQRRI
jgi:hypothetical protein